jgi:hypothetical protein
MLEDRLKEDLLFDIESLLILKDKLKIYKTPEIIRNSYMTGTDIIEFYNCIYEKSLSYNKGV